MSKLVPCLLSPCRLQVFDAERFSDASADIELEQVLPACLPACLLAIVCCIVFALQLLL